MNWRTATTTADTSGSHLFQSAYVNTSGKITSFTDGDTKVEKWIKNDYSAINYKKILSYIGVAVDTTTKATLNSTNGFNYTTVGAFGSGVTMTGGADGIIWKNKIFCNQYVGSAAKSYRSDDNGATWNEISTTTASVKYYGTSTALYMYKYTSNYFKRSTDGITWNTVATLGYASGLTQFKGQMVATQGADLMVSTDDGLSFTGYNPLLPATYGGLTPASQYILGCAKFTVSGQERMYFLMKYTDSMGAKIHLTAYITAVPTADDFAITVVGNLSGYGYGMSDATELRSIAEGNGNAIAVLDDTFDMAGTHLYYFVTGTVYNYGFSTLSTFYNRTDSNLYAYIFVPVFMGGPSTSIVRVDGSTRTTVTSSFTGIPNGSYGASIITKPA